MAPDPSRSKDADDVLAQQIGALWMALRAFGAAHPDLDGLILALRAATQRLSDHQIAEPASDRASEIALAALQEVVDELERVRKDRAA